jgi:hypothetical protein
MRRERKVQKPSGSLQTDSDAVGGAAESSAAVLTLSERARKVPPPLWPPPSSPALHRGAAESGIGCVRYEVLR